MKPGIAFLISFLFTFSDLALGQIPGCTDPLANNYFPAATLNDGSCTYSRISLAPENSYLLSDSIKENSGLIFWDKHLWTHNDDTDTCLYQLDTLTGKIRRKLALKGVKNTDWEELDQDDSFIYIGDIGNNKNGNRTDLHILRVSKYKSQGAFALADTISFYYEDQTNFNPKGPNKTDFDAEAFLIREDSIFLFTKDWPGLKTRVYSLSKKPGNQAAQFRFEWDVGGLITGATQLPRQNAVVLSGYSPLLQPFLFLMYDFSGNAFFAANKRKIELSLSFHQIEGIATPNGLKYFISNEHFVQAPLIETMPKLHVIDLTAFLGPYLSALSKIDHLEKKPLMEVLPIPANQTLFLHVSSNLAHQNWILTNLIGTPVLTGPIQPFETRIDISFLNPGVYFLKMEGSPEKGIKVIKI